MLSSQPVFAVRSMRFGRAPLRAAEEHPERTATFSEDLKLFAATFLAGFLFVSILIV